MSKSKNPFSELSFEEAAERLEQLVASMEEGDIPLETLVSKCEEGNLLRQVCEEKLKQAELKIMKIKALDGSMEKYVDNKNESE